MEKKTTLYDSRENYYERKHFWLYTHFLIYEITWSQFHHQQTEKNFHRVQKKYLAFKCLYFLGIYKARDS